MRLAGWPLRPAKPPLASKSVTLERHLRLKTAAGMRGALWCMPPKSKRPGNAGSFSQIRAKGRLRVLLRDLGNLRGETRHLAARRLLVNDALLAGAHELRLRCLKCSECCVAIAAGNRLFDLADIATHHRTTMLIDLGATLDHARLLLG